MRKVDTAKEIILILGMHRSATSLTAKLLYEFGIYLGETKDMLIANEYNQEGYYERKDVVELHDSILWENDMYWMSIRKNYVYDYGKSYEEQMDAILNKLCEKSSESPAAVKDPRLCIFEPMWHDKLKNRGLKEKIIVVFRHPYEVAKSLGIRDNINFYYALKLWFYYNNSILNLLLRFEADDVLFVNHNDYFIDADVQIQRIAKFLNLNCDSKKYIGNIKEKLRHNYVEQLNENKLNEMVMSLYLYFLDLKSGNTILCKDDVQKFNLYWDKIYYTSYDNKNLDMPGVIYRIKSWCLSQLTTKKIMLINRFKQYFFENNIQEISIYGDGTIAAEFYKVLNELNINIKRIIDREPHCNSILIHKMNVPVINLDLVNLDKGDIIINTVVNHAEEITDLFIERFPTAKVLVLSDILFEFIEEKPNGER